jgi:Flp pilus assembly pilin Flp
MLSMLKRLWREEFGDDTLEYALLVALIVIAALSSIYTYGLANSKAYERAAIFAKAASGSAAGQAGGGSGGSGQGDSGSGGQGDSGSGGQGGSGSGGQGGSGSGGQGGSDQSGSGGQGGSAGAFPTNPVPVK